MVKDNSLGLLGLSVSNGRFSTDENEYESVDYSDPPSSIMVERPAYKSASSVKEGKRLAQPTKA
jgi:hypothetical protein